MAMIWSSSAAFWMYLHMALALRAEEDNSWFQVHGRIGGDERARANV
jgi:hypothetical protein